MTFLNPLVLFGLVAAAIPLIIHLFNFRRPRKIDFSSVAFLKELQKSTMQRIKIQQWLLLALRTLAVAALILTFSRPTLTGSLAGRLGGRASSAVAVVVDNSLSMTLRDAQGAYLDQARTLASGVVDQVEPGDEVFVWPVAGAPETEPTAYKNRSPALDAVAEIEEKAGASSLARTVARASTLLEASPHLNKEIYVVSDLQQSMLLDTLATLATAGIRVVLLPVGDRHHNNVAVTDVQVESRIVEPEQPVRIVAKLVNYGTERVEGYVASLYLEGERVAQTAADLDPGVETSVVFAATPQRRGWLSGLVQIEDDDFEHDNLRYFTLHVPERRRLLLVQGEGQRTDFIELALSSQITGGRMTLDLERVSESALAATTLSSYDAVILAGPRDLSSGEVATLTQYVEGGGGLLVFPAETARAADYNALFAGLGGGTFSGFSGVRASGRVIARFDQVDLEHPLFEGVFEQTTPRDEAQVESPDVFFAMNYAPRASTEQTLIQLSNGFPFLQEIRHQDGVAFVAATAPDPGWSDLPMRGFFIPLLYRSISYLSAGDAVQGDQLVTGQPAALRLAGISDAEPVRMMLAGTTGSEITPTQQSLFGAVLLQLDASLQTPGIYDVMVGTSLVRRVALNIDRRESDLRVVDPEEAAEKLAEATGLPVRALMAEAGGIDRLLKTLEAERSGVEIWNVFLLVALLALVAELLVSMRWRPETASA